MLIFILVKCEINSEVKGNGVKSPITTSFGKQTNSFRELVVLSVKSSSLSLDIIIIQYK